MFTKEITYTDFNGNECTETLYFNLSKVEVNRWDASLNGGLQAFLNEVANSNDSKKIFSLFEELALKSYGVKSEDGKRFIKSDELRDEFAQSAAYSEFMASVLSSVESAEEFVKSIIY